MLLQYYPVLQSTTPVLLCTTKNYSSTTLYYKVLCQYYSGTKKYYSSTTLYYKVLLCTTKYYSSTILYYKVLLRYYSVLQSTTPVLLWLAIALSPFSGVTEVRGAMPVYRKTAFNHSHEATNHSICIWHCVRQQLQCPFDVLLRQSRWTNEIRSIPNGA